MTTDAPHFFASPWIDRAGMLRRDAERLAAMRSGPDARFLLVRGDRSLVIGTEPPAALALSAEELPAELAGPEAIFLGLEDDRPWFAAPIAGDAEPELPERARFVDLRREGPLMSARDGGLLAYARAIVHWHETHRFCGRCGAPTAPEDAGFLRRCQAPGCGRQHFPCTDPAIIVRVVHGDRLLLARQPSWPARWYSVLAGFVEPGESLEDAVRREVGEETGVTLGRVAYFGSQPWPFPASLMIGYQAEALDDDLRLDSDELEDARWMTRDEIAAEVAAGELRLPTETSIARRLVDAWLRNSLTRS